MGLKLRIDTSDVQTEVNFWNGANVLTRRIIWKTLRVKTMKAIGIVKQQMPVDTGRARADWGSSPEFNESELETVHGSRLVYVPFLNEGWSQQAPAGFIDAIVLRMGIELSADLGVDVDVVLGD